MEIVKYGHPVLRWKSSPLTSISPAFKATVAQMFDLMYEAKGIGLAANQVGLPYRFFLVNCTADPKEKDEEMVFINPEIKRRKGSTEGEEGCLSLPELYGEVPRPEEIIVEAFDLNGEGFEMQASDLLARVILHENDHLDGVLFIDRMKPEERAQLQPNLADFEKDFRSRQKSGEYPTDDAIKAQLAEMVKTFDFPGE
jgi:peptide deformylase